MEDTIQTEAHENPEDAGLRIIHLDDFTPPVALPLDEQETYVRRFSTLFVDENRCRKGGLGQVLYGRNSWGESLAIKILTEDDGTTKEPDGDADEQAESFAAEAFKREYETMRTLSNIKGFPQLHGRGTIDGRNAIVMEWVEGETLATAIRHISIDDENRLSPLTAAQLGRDLFALLARMEVLDKRMVHRDISTSNIMIDTATRSLDEQVAAGSFDLKLVDFGSAVFPSRSSSLTQKYGTPRGATPDFAAPEMLTDDIANAAAMRKNPAVDVYAAASVLYLLLSGHTPFDLVKDEDRSYYLRKTEQLPRALTCAHANPADITATLKREPQTAALVEEAVSQCESRPSDDKLAHTLDEVDAQLDDVIFACLDPVQEYRPEAGEVRDSLARFVESYGDNIACALAGRPLDPCAGSAFAQRAQEREARRGRRLGTGIAIAGAALLLAASIVTGMLVASSGATFALGPLRWDAALGGWLFAISLWLPAALGCVARIVARGKTSALAWVAAAVFVSGAALLVTLGFMVFSSASIFWLLLGSIAVCTMLPWCTLSFGIAIERAAAKPTERTTRD